jgi:8-oxo-dGTP pyrophosphatase MutT (NUDIX family)
VGRIRAALAPLGARIVPLEEGAVPPHFALAWLGMGNDGHIASLFPNTDPRADAPRKIIRLPRPLPPEAPFDRLSMTIPSLVDADALVFVARGEEKRALFEAALRGDHTCPWRACWPPPTRRCCASPDRTRAGAAAPGAPPRRAAPGAPAAQAVVALAQAAHRGRARAGAGCGGRVLLVRHSYGPSRWMPPGGGMKPGEDPLIAAARELQEELGCRLAAPRVAAVTLDRLHGAGNTVHVVVGACEGRPTPDLREITEAGFFAPDALPPDVAASVAAGCACGWKKSDKPLPTPR